MSVRVQVILDEEEREFFRRKAAKEGLSLSAWLRRAAHQTAAADVRPRISTVDDLQAFFREREAREPDRREPDWEEHLAVIRRSLAPGSDS